MDVKSSDALLELLRNEAIQSSNSLKLATQVYLFSRYHDFFVGMNVSFPFCIFEISVFHDSAGYGCCQEED